MKFIFLLLVVSSSCYGQSLDSIPLDGDGKAKYEIVIEAPGTAAELTTRVKMWAAEAFPSGLKPFIRVEDKEQGLLSGNGSLNYTYQLYQIKKKTVVPRTGNLTSGVGKASFALTFYMKDNKVKAVFTNIVLTESYFDEELNGTVFGTEFIALVKSLLAGTLKDQERGTQYNSIVPAITEHANKIFDYIRAYLNKKADNNF